MDLSQFQIEGRASLKAAARRKGGGGGSSPAATWAPAAFGPPGVGQKGPGRGRGGDPLREQEIHGQPPSLRPLPVSGVKGAAPCGWPLFSTTPRVLLTENRVERDEVATSHKREIPTAPPPPRHRWSACSAGQGVREVVHLRPDGGAAPEGLGDHPRRPGATPPSATEISLKNIVNILALLFFSPTAWRVDPQNGSPIRAQRRWRRLPCVASAGAADAGGAVRGRGAGRPGHCRAARRRGGQPVAAPCPGRAEGWGLV